MNLTRAAEAAGIERFVYVSMLGDHAAARTPFTDAKAATEGRLRESPLREVVVRPDAFQEVWLGSAGAFDLAAGTVRIYGKGLARRRHVGIDDVAEAVVRLALADIRPARSTWRPVLPMRNVSRPRRAGARRGRGRWSVSLPRA